MKYRLTIIINTVIIYGYQLFAEQPGPHTMRTVVRSTYSSPTFSSFWSTHFMIASIVRDESPKQLSSMGVGC